MGISDLNATLKRLHAVLRRRPAMGMHNDDAATASWRGGTRVVTWHTNGTEISSDMPTEIGGSGDRITPGWLFRAGLAACANTSIALAAADQGIELTLLNVSASSRSDTRGLLGMAEDGGARVSAAPQDVQLHVRVAARGVAAQTLRALVQEGCRRSPVPNAVQASLPIDLRIETIDD